METPSSTRRVTRSQTLAASSNRDNQTSKKMEDSSNKGPLKSRPETGRQDRSALFDITNDSPIVGLASGSLGTPVSSIAKQRSNLCKRTPGSGEALLRGQVKTLLQRVQEEEAISKFSLESYVLTPKTTPKVSAMNELGSSDSVFKPPIEDLSKISQVVCGIFDGKQQAESAQESDKDLISRSLFHDFTEKSDSSSDCSSEVTYQGADVTADRESQVKSVLIEDDDSSFWSIQVNTSTRDEDEEEDEVIGEYIEQEEDYGEEGEAEETDMLLVDELCEGISMTSVNGEKKGATITFKGQHTRFMYNSDEELVAEHQEFSVTNGDDSHEVLHLKGLPTPKGKHLRFQADEDE